MPYVRGELCWDSAEMAADSSDDFADDDTAVINYFHCRRCGRSYEVIDPPQEERETEYKEFWNG